MKPGEGGKTWGGGANNSAAGVGRGWKMWRVKEDLKIMKQIRTTTSDQGWGREDQ